MHRWKDGRKLEVKIIWAAQSMRTKVQKKDQVHRLVPLTALIKALNCLEMPYGFPFFLFYNVVISFETLLSYPLLNMTY